MPPEVATKGELILDGGNGLLDVPLTAGRNQVIGSVEGQWISRRICVIGKEELAGAAGGNSRSQGCDIFIGRHDILRQYRIPLLVVLHDLSGILQVPVVRYVNVDVRGKPGSPGSESIIQR